MTTEPTTHPPRPQPIKVLVLYNRSEESETGDEGAPPGPVGTAEGEDGAGSAVAAGDSREGEGDDSGHAAGAAREPTASGEAPPLGAGEVGERADRPAPAPATAATGADRPAAAPATAATGAEGAPPPAPTEGEGGEPPEGPGELAEAAEDGGASDAGASIAAQGAEIARALERRGLAVALADAEDELDRILDALVLERPALVFNLVDQFYGDGTLHAAVAALLDLLGVPYTGSDPLALSTCQDRARTRLILENAGVAVPRYAIVRDVNAIPDTSELHAPLIVTQSFDDCYDEEGEARPIASRAALEERLYELARDYDLPLFVEEYLAGRRLHAVVVGGRVLDVLPICESDVGWEDWEDEDEGEGEREEEADADADAGAAADAGARGGETAADDGGESEGDGGESEDDGGEGEDDGGESEDDGGEGEDDGGEGEDDGDEGEDDDSDDASAVRLAQLDPATADRVRALAQRAFRATGCRDLAQIDVHLTDAGALAVIDVRPAVDFGPESPIQVAASAREGGFDAVVEAIARCALERSRPTDEGAADASGAPPASAHR